MSSRRPLVSSLALLSWRPLRARETWGPLRALPPQRTRSTTCSFGWETLTGGAVSTSARLRLVAPKSCWRSCQDHQEAPEPGVAAGGGAGSQQHLVLYSEEVPPTTRPCHSDSASSCLSANEDALTVVDVLKALALSLKLHALFMSETHRQKTLNFIR